AGERTLLSYTRTSLVLASMGVALVHHFTISELTHTKPSSGKRLEKFSRPIRATSVVIAFIILAIGVAFVFISVASCCRPDFNHKAHSVNSPYKRPLSVASSQRPGSVSLLKRSSFLLWRLYPSSCWSLQADGRL
ncbi:hypothetical protein BDZ97DRAFT_1665651, partial [Flammula alnicola]